MDLMIALLWAHPLAWLLRSQWREEIEHQADRAVLARISHTFRREAQREPCSGKEGADFGGGLCEFTLSTAKIKPDAANAWLPRAAADKCENSGLGQIEADEYASDLLRLVRTGHTPPPPIGVAFAHSSSSNRFRRRLLRLFETPNESKRSGAIACIAAALLFAFTLLALSCHILPDSAPEMTVETQLRLNANPFPTDF